MASIYGLFDLITMLLGARIVKNPPTSSPSGRAFWTDEGEPRDLVWFWNLERNPFLNYSRYPAWLLSQILEHLVDEERPFRGFQAEDILTMDLLESHIYPDMPGASAYTRAFTQPSSSPYLRHFRTSLVAGFSNTPLPDGNIITFGGGLRRQTKIHKPGLEQEALVADMDLFVPFYMGTEEFGAIPQDRDIPADVSMMRFGISITRQGRPLGSAEPLEVAGIRFYVGIPINLHREEDASKSPSFGLGEPIFRVETLPWTPGSNTSSWQLEEDTESWENIANAFLKSGDAVALLKAPMGPITAQPIDRDSVLEVLKNGLDPYKESGKRSLEEWQEIQEFLEGFLQYGRVPEPADDENDPPDISNLRTIGGFLTTLRLIKENIAKKKVIAPWDDRSILEILNHMAGELDGFPLWLKGIDPDDQEDQDPPMPPLNVAIQLAAQARQSDPSTHFFGLRGMGFNIPLKKPLGHKKKRDIEILLHLGKYFRGESRDNNWIRRLEPLQADGKTPAPSRLPGIGIYPFTLTLPDSQSGSTPRPAWGFRIDLTSLGLDIRGRNDLGLVDLPFFKLGGIELRTLFSLDWVQGQTWPETVFAVGVKFTKIRILTKREEKEEEPDPDDLDAELYGGIEELFAEEDEDDKLPDLDTRLSNKVKDQFSLSLGFMTGIGPETHPRFDAQLYDAKGRPGKVVWINIDRQKKHIYLKSIGIQLSGTSNVNLDEGPIGKKMKLTLMLTGGLRFANFELGFIGASITMPFNDMSETEFGLEGLDLSIKVGSVAISGSFLKTKKEFAGYVRLQLPSLTIGAMGAFGKTESGETTLFIYGALTFAEGGGFGGAAFRLTGIALGFGINRRVIIPEVGKVASFPLVQMVMGKGGLQEGKDPGSRLGKPMESPMDVLGDMAGQLKAEDGQNFGALGLRFTLAETVDCFALGIVQFGNELEISLLGIARMALPKGADGEDTPAICYAELQLAATFKPKAGLFKFEAVLSNNSWIFHKNCRLTGGFAIYIWFDGKHKGDFVITFGGYHPRFLRPAHYPSVPRIGIRWPVSENLLIKGGLYLAITPSCAMAGGSLEACFKTQRIRAWFNLYLDLVLEWNPLYFELAMGLGIKVEVDLILFSFSGSLHIDFQVWGPPFGAIATVDFEVFSFDIPIGSSRDEAVPKTIGTWQEFLDSVLLPANEDTTANAVPQLGLNLVSGLASQKKQRTNETEEEPPPVVRADELQFSLTQTVPTTEVLAGQLSKDSLQRLPQDTPAQTTVLPKPIEWDRSQAQANGADVRVRPMDADYQASLSLAVVHEDQQISLDLAEWTIEPTHGSLPASMWDPEPPESDPNRQPDAKLIDDCITGLSTVRPPLGHLAKGLDQQVNAKVIGWDTLPTQQITPEPTSPETAQTAPIGDALATALNEKKTRRQDIAQALADLGFPL